jgi:hypothetical protein
MNLEKMEAGLSVNHVTSLRPKCKAGAKNGIGCLPSVSGAQRFPSLNQSDESAEYWATYWESVA